MCLRLKVCRLWKGMVINMENGLIHIYCGNGKGKTTCAMGLLMRCAGQGGKVLCFQFLKSDTSGECRILEKIENVTLLPCYDKVKFTSRMNEEEKAQAKSFYGNRFHEITQLVQEGSYDMLVLDEIMAAISVGFLSEEEVVTFLRNKPHTLEVVMTGREPGMALLEMADYVTEMKQCKHPYEKGITARRMVEW